MSASKIAFVSVLSVAGFIAVGSAFASTTVNVTLSDKGGEAGMPTGMGMGMTHDMSKAPLMVRADHSTVKAGDVEFDVTNTSKDLVHEMLVIPVPASGQLPYKSSDSVVAENSAGSLGEVSELDPGTKGKLTLNLKPGKYALLCNIPGHFNAGMWTTLTVTP